MRRVSGLSPVGWNLVGVLVLTGCAAATRPKSQPKAMASPAPSASPSQPLPSFEALAARGLIVAPGMRESSRDEGIAPLRRQVLEAVDRDACARVVFAASGAVRASLEDRSGTSLGDEASGSSGTTGKRGPLCIRR